MRKEEGDNVTIIECNMCGHTERSDEQGLYIFDHFHSVKFYWGYDTPHDLEKWSFDLCMSCAEKLTRGLVTPVEVTELSPYYQMDDDDLDDFGFERPDILLIEDEE